MFHGEIKIINSQVSKTNRLQWGRKTQHEYWAMKQWWLSSIRKIDSCNYNRLANKLLILINWHNYLLQYSYYQAERPKPWPITLKSGIKTPRDQDPRTTRSPAVARMADRTAPVVKLTLTLTQILPGACTAAKRAIIWQKQALLPLMGQL